MNNAQTLEGLVSGAYHGVTRLKLCAGLARIPEEVFQLHETLEILDLSGNPLSCLPDHFYRLRNLKVAFFSDCNFTVFPKQLAKCASLEMLAFKSNRMTQIPEGAFPPRLRWLILTNNLLEEIPRSIGDCDRLQKCMLAGNRLTNLPKQMACCKKLGLLRLSVNRIWELPDWLFEEMPELSFLAFAGNPCATSFEDNRVLGDIAWEDLSVLEFLGEGASGIISQGVWRSNEGQMEVAIKLFKGEVTSDGSPMDEMMACINAGSHPNLIDPIAKIRNHPETRGLVLQLIPSHYANLGLPPNFDTCTRNNFPAGTRMSIEDCFGILRGIASVSKHLHSRGISHGDLYAHNILVDGGNAILGDFGAATIYGNKHAKAAAIECLEVVGFGGPLDILVDLHSRCVSPQVSGRPSFAEILDSLS